MARARSTTKKTTVKKPTAKKNAARVSRRPPASPPGDVGLGDVTVAMDSMLGDPSVIVVTTSHQMPKITYFPVTYNGNTYYLYLPGDHTGEIRSNTVLYAAAYDSGRSQMINFQTYYLLVQYK
jgi:hypothetical protein